MSRATRRIFELKEYRESRNIGEDNDFMLTITLNLLKNLGDRSNFIHHQLAEYKNQKKGIDNNLKIITGQYVCSLITCWETFFRDLFIFLCNTDNEIKTRLESELIEEISFDLTIGEYSARKFNFQNLGQIREAFDFIFQKETIQITDYFTKDIFNGVFNSDYELILKWIHEGTFKTNINNVLEKGFKIRHRVTHDANYLIDFDSKLLFKIECVFHVIPQFFIANFAEKYFQKRVVFNMKERYLRITNSPTENEKNYAFNPSDFMANDYKIVG